MTAVNTSIIGHLMSDASAARQQAQRDYDAIVFNHRRNTPEDRATLASAMTILGKSHQDVLSDHAAVVAGNDLAEVAGNRADAEKAIAAAEAAFNEFYRVTKPAALKQLEDMEHSLRYAKDGPHNRLNEALLALHELRRHRAKFQHLRQQLPKDPDSSPDEIRINGQWIDPSRAAHESLSR